MSNSKKNVLSIWKVYDEFTLTGSHYELKFGHEVISTHVDPASLVAMAIYLNLHEGYKLTDTLYKIRNKFSNLVYDFEDFEINNGVVF